MLNIRQIALTSVILFSSTLATADGIQDALKKYYPQYSPSQKCRLLNSEQGSFCMREHTQKIINTDKGQTLYLLMSGNNMVKTCHACSGVVGMFVFENNQSDWRLSHAKEAIYIGAYGEAPRPSDWTFHQFGIHTAGFLNKISDVHQGVVEGGYTILLPNRQTGISEHFLKSIASNVGFYDCETYPNPQECKQGLQELESTIKIRRDLPPQGGIYPLQLNVTGFDGPIKYNNKQYIAKYNPKKQTYELPKNYPIQW